MKHLRLLGVAALWLAITFPAFAQWQVPSHALPVGRGPGGVGFNSAAPGLAGTVPLSQGTTSDPVFQPITGDCGLTSAGVLTCTKINSVSYPAGPAANTVPVVTSASAGGSVTYEPVPNAALANASTTVNGTVCTLGSACSPPATATAITVGGTSIVSGTNGSNEYNNGGVLGERAQIPLANGGTNANLTAQNGGLIYSSASDIRILPPTATAGQIPQSGASAAPTWSTSTYPATSAAGTVLSSLTGNTVTASAHPVLGAVGTTGAIGFSGTTSGVATVTPQATAGSPTLTLPNTSGTLADGATSPLVLSATTGALTCPTCATSSGGGAVTGTAPVAVSGAGVVSITGAPGQVLAGASPAFTATPTLGVAGSALGSVTLDNATSGGVTIAPPTGALGTPTFTTPNSTTSDTFVSRTSTDTLTNKTLTSPVMTTPTLGAASGTSLQLSGLTASSNVQTDASKNLVSVTNTGTGNNVLANSPTLVTPALGTPSAVVLTSATGLPLTTGVTGNLPVTNLNSGTGASSSTFWRGDGTWVTPSGAGTVTSVGATVPSLLSVAGSPITGAGTLAFTYSGTPLPIANGGTNSTTGAFVKINVQTFCASGCTTTVAGGSSGTYTPTTGLLYAIIECQGGGGGSGGVSATVAKSYGGGGGASGSPSRSYASAATIGASQTVTNGAGGTAGTATTSGGAGGATSLGSICTAPGGGGGGFTDGSTGFGVGGTAGAAGTGNIVATQGQNGGPGTVASISTVAAVSGQGGSAGYGIGALGPNNDGGSANPGNAGKGYGGGASGAAGDGSSVTAIGAAGATGITIVTEYLNQ